MMNPTEKLILEYDAYLNKLSMKMMVLKSYVIRDLLETFRFDARNTMKKMLEEHRKQINYFITRALLAALLMKYEEELRQRMRDINIRNEGSSEQFWQG